MAAPTKTGRIIAIRTLVRKTGNHAKILREASDIGPLVAVAELVVYLRLLLRDAVETGFIAIPVEGRAPVQALIPLDASSGALGIDKILEGCGST